MVGDGDTGFGNAMNVKRTVWGYQRAGFACVMIEDQVMPKRCGHTALKRSPRTFYLPETFPSHPGHAAALASSGNCQTLCRLEEAVTSLARARHVVVTGRV